MNKQDNTEIQQLQVIYKTAYIAGKKIAVDLQKRGDIENSLNYICSCGAFAQMYATGIWYDDELENLISDIGNSLAEKIDRSNSGELTSPKQKIIYVASFLTDTGGHSEICRMWIKMLNENFKQYLFVTGAPWSGIAEYSQIPPEFISKLDGADLNAEVIGGTTYIERIINITKKIGEVKPDFVVLFIVPGDVIALCSLAILRHCFKEKFRVVYYNHTNISYWMGKQLTDIIVDYSEPSAYLARKFKGCKGDIRIVPLTTDAHLRNHHIKPSLTRISGQTISVSIGRPWRLYSDGTWNFFETIKKILEENPNHLHILLTLRADFIEKEISVWRKDIRERLMIIYNESNPVKYYKISDFYIDTFPFSGGQGRIEAISTGLPILIIDNQQLKLIGHVGKFLLKNENYRYVAKNNGEVVQYANELITDPEIRKNLRQLMNETFAKYYSMEHVRSHLLHLFTNSDNTSTPDYSTKYDFDFDSHYIFSHFTRCIGFINTKVVEPVKIALSGNNLQTTNGESENMMIKILTFLDQIEQLENIIAEKNEQITEKERQIIERDERIASITTDALKMTNSMECLRAKLDDTERKLQKIYGSDGWKALLIYYNTRNFLIPPDSLRKKLMHSCFKHIKALIR
ncbi:MAG: glycosyltransferase [Planctomycetes bacterium]|nr:glycosyltransferase [Planctomycetota bacterium]